MVLPLPASDVEVSRPLPQSRSAEAFYSDKKVIKNGKRAHEPVAFVSAETALFAKQAVRACFAAHATTLWGDAVVIVGSSKQLGAWDPLRSSVMLSTDKLAYPLWKSSPVELEMPADGRPLEYKVVVLRASSGGGPPLAEWEPLTDNRKLAPHARHESKAAHIALSYGEPGASIQWRWEW